MNIKKLNISYDAVTSKILFDIDVDGISCRGSVDTRKSEDLIDVLYSIEEGCQKIRRKIGEKECGMRSAELRRISCGNLHQGEQNESN